MALTSLSDYRRWLNGSNERAPEQPAVPPEILPLDTKEPFMDSRAELMLAADDLCLAAYTLMDGKTEDLTGKPPRVYERHIEGYQNGRYINQVEKIRYWEITDTKIGSQEQIPVPRLDESMLDTVTLANIELAVQEEELRGYMNEIDSLRSRQNQTNWATLELTQNARTFIAACPTGLAMVTEAYDELRKEWRVLKFEQNTVNPDDIFVPSTEQAEHQDRYQQLMRLMVQHFGEYLPQAPDRREVVGMQLGKVGAYGEVDISGFTLFPETLAAIKQTMGKPHGLAWPLFNVETVAAEAADVFEPASDEAEVIPAEPQYDETPLDSRQEDSDEPAEDVLDELDTLRFHVCERAFELMRLYGLEQNEPYGLGVPYDKGDTRYIFHHNMFEGYGERASITKITPKGYKNYDIFTIEKYPGAIPHKGEPMTLKKGKELLRVLDAMIAKAQRDTHISWS